MKIAFSLALLSGAAALRSPTTQSRELENNDYGNYYQNANGQQYENFEEYMKAKMASRTFSFTGCSSVQGAYSSQTYVTYRLCDSCSSNFLANAGCDASNGDYVVTMQQFSETFSEYRQEVTGQEFSPFECQRAEEFIEKYYEFTGQYNGEDGEEYANDNANGGNNNGQQNEYFVGPKCTSGGHGIELGLFLNDGCSIPAQKNTLQTILGFSPNKVSMKVQKCIGCTLNAWEDQEWANDQGEEGEEQQQQQEQQAQDAELNPLCERMLERSGRCDRSMGDVSGGLDEFWKDVVAFVNDGGSTDFSNGDYDQAQQQDEADQDAAEGEYNNYNAVNYNSNNYYGNNAYGNNGMSYYNYNKRSTCDVISNLPHMMGVWDSLKSSALNNYGISTGGLIMIVFAVALVLVGIAYAALKYVANKGSEALVASQQAENSKKEESDTPYAKADEEKGTATKSWVSLS